jgi:Tol biopolymer transport system component
MFPRMRKRRSSIRHSLLLALAAAATGCMGGDENHLEIAYGVVRDDVPTRITVVRDDGKDAQRITGAQRGKSPVLPAWSPDGQRIAFVRYNPAGGPGAVQVYVVNADGTGERHLGEGTLPQWTRDGRFVVVERVRTPPKSSTIHVLSVDGGGDRRLAVGSSPVVSRDGSTVAFVRHTYRPPEKGACCVVATSTLNTISLDGTGLRRIARMNGPGRYIQPSWLPGDTAVAAIERQGGLAGPLVTVTPSGRRRVVTRPVGETYDWSPKGDLIAYTRGAVLYVIRRDGTEVDAFGQSDAIDIEFSPDGKKVAFSVLEVAETQTDFIGIYVIDLEEKVRKRFVLAEGFVAYFDWRPLPLEEEDG